MYSEKANIAIASLEIAKGLASLPSTQFDIAGAIEWVQEMAILEQANAKLSIKMENKNEPAHPDYAHYGISKREFAAIQMMSGLCACPDVFGSNETIAYDSVNLADALFNELDKSEE